MTLYSEFLLRSLSDMVSGTTAHMILELNL
jgi:hypothetical protein